DTTRISLSPLASNPTDTTICWFNSTPVKANTPFGVPPFRYVWEANPQLSDTLGQRVIAKPDTVVGLYQYFVRITDSLNCVSNRATANVRVVRPGRVNLSNPLACEGDTIPIFTTPNPGVNVTQYNWFRNGIRQPGNASQLDIYRNGSYKLIYLDGFCPDSSFIDVNFNPKPIPINTPEYLFCRDTTVFDTTTIVLDAGPATRWLWDRGDTTRKIRVDRKGVYYFTLFNEFECSIRDSAILKDECPPRLFVPDAFTPNGDRNNDKFNVYYAYIKNFKMWIFNRWGEVIYYTEDPTQPWDGFYREELMQPGTYPWLIQYDAAVDKFGKNFKKEGRVTVIR
ncbi:MAG: gliding motility-associated C-terminal domain-containing protein, partial [Cytophagales bacterium]